MIAFLGLGAAFAGELVVEAKLPAQVVAGAETVAQLAEPGRASVVLDDGTHHLTVFAGGKATEVDVQVSSSPTVLLVGKNGITARQQPVPVGGAGSVEIRNTSSDSVMVVLNHVRHVVEARASLDLPLAAGTYAMDVRNVDGTLIWARGTLRVVGGGPLVVQVANGQMPETGGPGGEFLVAGK